MSEQVTIRNASGTPIWHATVHNDSIKLEIESYDKGPNEPDFGSHESIPDSEFPKICEQYGYQPDRQTKVVDCDHLITLKEL